MKLYKYNYNIQSTISDFDGGEYMVKLTQYSVLLSLGRAIS